MRDFLVDEWLPTQRPPTLEESTHTSYARSIRLHVVPHIGGLVLIEKLRADGLTWQQAADEVGDQVPELAGSSPLIGEAPLMALR